MICPSPAATALQPTFEHLGAALKHLFLAFIWSVLSAVTFAFAYLSKPLIMASF